MTSIPGLTKMRSIGPLAAELDRCGGSIERVFRRADLPLRLIEEPERLILLSDQLRLLDRAAREIGDPTLPARLSIDAGFATLGHYGAAVLDAPLLGLAIKRANALMGTLLQSATRVELHLAGTTALWRYRVTDASTVGRQLNEILAVGYMLDLLRRFLGRGWVPLRASVGGGTLASRGAIEQRLGCDLSLGSGAEVAFAADLLTTSNPHAAGPAPARGAPGIPTPVNLTLCAECFIELDLMERRPSIDRLCRHLGLPRRSVQRHLKKEGATFERILQTVLVRQSRDLLRQEAASLAEIAQMLGYSDQAHFSRAFRSWTGSSPKAWRRGPV